MKNILFADMFTETKGSKKKWVFIPLSLIAHALVLGILVVGPLMSNTGAMPTLKVFEVTLNPPAPPAPPRAQGRPSAIKAKPKPQTEAPKPINNDFVAPLTIPTEIKEEKLSSMFPEGTGGVDYGEGIYNDDLGYDGTVPGGIFDGDSISGPLTTVKQPRLIKKIAPDYPAVAIRARIEGDVIIMADTDIYGHVNQVQVSSGHPLLRSAAVEAVKKWVYEPYIINGMPKAVRFTVTVNFRLSSK